MPKKVRCILGIGLISIVASAGCDSTHSTVSGGTDPAGHNPVHSGEDVDVVIGDDSNTFRVINRGNVATGPDIISAGEAARRDLVGASATADVAVKVPRSTAPRDSLVVGYPIRLLGQNAVVGGVITRISDPDDEFLGGFKLSQLPPLHIRPFVARGEDGRYGFTLFGCEFDCTETSPQEPLLTIPIAGVDVRRQQVLLDISALGEGLSIETIIDPAYLGLTEVATRATLADYSTSTLVFDVVSTMERIPAEGVVEQADDAEPLFITVRWYIKLGSGFSDAFAVREAIPEVGFFETYRNRVPRITRFPVTQYRDRPPIRYFIKNVPAQYRDAFSQAFEDWNEVFRGLLGYDLLEYHHIAADHPLNPLLVTGDVRFNIVEWDLDNQAFYGGFGPSAAHQFTGEIFAGLVLIQGPSIIQLYSDWFNVVEQARALRRAGAVAQAEVLLVEARRRLEALIPTPRLSSSRIKLGRLPLTVEAERPELHDPLMSPFDFDETPEGVTFDSYMQGYFRELAAHEIGHNLGLRHNFMGSLSGNGADVSSHSVMEYVIRIERYKTKVGAYDEQAAGYGYAGLVPTEPLPYCTDFEVVWLYEPTLSAECSRSDGGPDSFVDFRERRVRRAVDLVIGRGLGAAPPAWTPDDVSPQLWEGVQGMAFYATSAEATSHTWFNFFADPMRPTAAEAIANYVVEQIQETVCEPSIAAEIEAKYAQNPEAGKLARENWSALLDQVASVGALLDLPIGSCALSDELPF
ncbi:MAG: zinc-dependent metalloprotease [Proteobacteria bacterium]|nr:zinc-dependent metalloprotease [Pseudomonadota bacterium]